MKPCSSLGLMDHVFCPKDAETTPLALDKKYFVEKFWGQCASFLSFVRRVQQIFGAILFLRFLNLRGLIFARFLFVLDVSGANENYIFLLRCGGVLRSIKPRPAQGLKALETYRPHHG